jgi:ABC-type Fe3+-hydroxamate transport system substrate-binding protein
MRYVDALERTLEVKAPPKRIVSLVPSLTEALFVFGRGKAIVGVTDYCVEPKEGVAAKTKVGGTKTLNVSRLLDLQPDIVVASAEENRKEDIQALVRAGLPVFVTLPNTVAEAIHLLEQLAEMTGAGKKAARVLDGAKGALAEAEGKLEDREPVRTFCAIWRGPWMTIGHGTYMHDLVRLCGGVNVFEWRHERYPRIELSEMAERNPQVVLLPDEPYRFQAKHVTEITAFTDISAVRSGRIHILDGKHLGWYGPRMAQSLKFVSSLIQGESG